MRVIRASEIGQFVFCQRAWWLTAIQGTPSANTRALAEGTAVHAAHGRAVARADWTGRLALALGILGLLALALWWFSA